MKTISFKTVSPDSHQDLIHLGQLAKTIWLQTFPGIISQAQIEYMLEKDYSLAALQNDIRNNDVIYKVIQFKNIPIGYVACGPLKETHTLKLSKIYLEPPFQRKGIGQYVFKRIKTKALKDGIRKIVLQVNRQNQKTISAYKKWGFVIQEPLVTDIGGGFVMDDYLMVFSLK